MDKNCKNCLFRERSYSEYPCEKCRNANFWTPSDNLLEFAIEELEKIKVEIKSSYINDYYGHNHGISKACEIIDKHISELKGENK